LIPSSSHGWSRWSPDSVLIDGHACSLQKKETKRQSKPLVHHACIRRTMLRLRSSARGRTKEDTNIRLKFMGSRFSKARKTSTCLHERPQTTQQLYLSPSTYTNTKIRRRNLRFWPQIKGPVMLLCTIYMSRHICFQESYCVHHLLHYIVVSPICSHHLFIFYNICVLFETKPEECSLLAPPLQSKKLLASQSSETEVNMGYTETKTCIYFSLQC